MVGVSLAGTENDEGDRTSIFNFSFPFPWPPSGPARRVALLQSCLQLPMESRSGYSEWDFFTEIDVHLRCTGCNGDEIC